MKSFPRVLLYVLLATVGGLLAGCVLGSLAMGLYTLLAEGVPHSISAGALALGLVMAMVAVIYGFLPALLYGAPAYALLFKWGHANYLTVSVLGALPGLALLLIQPDFGGMFLVFGIPVAWCTHFLAGRCPPLRRMGANSSFEPKSLSSSA